MITWALVSPTVWALVAGGLVTPTLIMILSHVVLPRHACRLRLERTSVSEIFLFGRWISLSSVLSFLGSMGDRLIFGKLFPIDFLGIYSIASRLERTPETLIQDIGKRVVFPALSQANRDASASLDNNSHITRLYIGIFGALAAAFLAASGSEIIAILYDERYREAGWILEILSIQVALVALETSGRNVLLAIGDTKSIFWVSAYRCVWILLVVAPLAYYLGAYEAVIGVVCMGVGSVILMNMILVRYKLYRLKTDILCIIIGVFSYVIVDHIVNIT